VIDFIRNNFVPVTTDINHSMFRKDESGDFFREIAEQGHYAGRTKPTGTRQGLYVALADGQLLASNNSKDPSEVLKMMRRGLAKQRRLNLTPSTKIKDQFQADPNYTTAFPDDGVILRVTSRDLPRESNSIYKTWRHNFDSVWLTADEMKSFAPPESGSPQVGQTYEIPSSVVARIAKYHLIDNVKGEVSHWEYDEVKIADARAKVTSVADGKVHIVLQGKVKCVQAPTGEVNPFNGQVMDSESGVELRLAGRMRWSSADAAIDKFYLIAYGDRWGASVYNFRHKDRQRNPIGFAFKLLPTVTENMIAPKALHRGYFE